MCEYSHCSTTLSLLYASTPLQCSTWAVHDARVQPTWLDYVWHRQFRPWLCGRLNPVHMSQRFMPCAPDSSRSQCPKCVEAYLAVTDVAPVYSRGWAPTTALSALCTAVKATGCSVDQPSPGYLAPFPGAYHCMPQKVVYLLMQPYTEALQLFRFQGSESQACTFKAGAQGAMPPLAPPMPSPKKPH